MWRIRREHGGVRPAGFGRGEGVAGVPAVAAGGAGGVRYARDLRRVRWGRAEPVSRRLRTAVARSPRRVLLSGGPQLLQLRAVPESPCDRGAAALAGEVRHRAARAEQTLPDGSYLTSIYALKNRKAKRDGVPPGSSSTGSMTPAARQRHALPAADHDPRPRPGTRRQARPALPTALGVRRRTGRAQGRTSAAPASCCAPRHPTASSKKSTATSASITRSAA